MVKTNKTSFKYWFNVNFNKSDSTSFIFRNDLFPTFFNMGMYCCILTFDPAKHAIPKWCTGRKWHIPMASNRKKLRRWIWLSKWDNVKTHDTLIDWCTGREWPLNCMTIISAWWRSNMPFQRLSGRLSGRLNYHITRWGRKSRVGDQSSWRQAW